MEQNYGKCAKTLSPFVSIWGMGCLRSIQKFPDRASFVAFEIHWKVLRNLPKVFKNLSKVLPQTLEGFA